MKRTMILILGGLFLMVAVRSTASIRSYYGGSAEGDNSVTLTIKADGSAVVTTDATQPRAMLEYQLRSWARYREAAEDMDEVDEVTAPAKVDAKPFTDDELKVKLRAWHEQRGEYSDAEDNSRLETIEVSTNSVRLVTTRTFGTLSEMFGSGLWGWAPTFLVLEDARFATKTNGQFEVSFSPAKMDARYLKNLTQQLKSRKLKQAWKLVLPGRIVSSSFPDKKENTTWVELDTSKPASIDTLMGLIGTNLTVIAEPGGLKLENALDSKSAMQRSRRGAPGEAGLPITDAGPGFLAEPVNLTVSTLYYFSEDAKRSGDLQMYRYGMQSTGTVVTAKLFPPKGRQIQAISGVRVIKAADDKGRSIVARTVEADDEFQSRTTFNFDGDEDSAQGSAQFALSMGLPMPDAQTIDSIEGEVIVDSIGGWREMVLPNVQADDKKEVDLGELLPGAKLVVTKINARQNQTTVSARLIGPKEIGQLDVKVKMAGRGSSNLSGRNPVVRGGITTRTISIRAYEYESGGTPKAAPTLVVRLPQNAKRERVQFRLTALDLL